LDIDSLSLWDDPYDGPLPTARAEAILDAVIGVLVRTPEALGVAVMAAPRDLDEVRSQPALRVAWFQENEALVRAALKDDWGGDSESIGRALGMLLDHLERDARSK
jgi:hypothetical protein